jgi:hypothetical protein
MARFLVAAVFTAVLAFPAHAEVEVLPLRHRTVEQVLPVLRPLVEPGGALTGMHGQLVVRATPGNIAELKRVLASIDSRPRRLVVSVRQDAEVERRDAGASGRIVVDSDARVRAEARVADTRRSAGDHVDQRVQVIEGGIAHIQAGRSIPVPGAYRDVSTGFAVRPRLSGEHVTLDINPRQESAGPAGAIDFQRIATSVSGRLGEWIELGGIGEQGTSSVGGLASSSSSSTQSVRSVWVRVDALD